MIQHTDTHEPRHMTAPELHYWQAVARKAGWRERRENAAVLLVCLPLLALLNAGWILFAVLTGRWWLAF